MWNGWEKIKEFTADAIKEAGEDVKALEDHAGKSAARDIYSHAGDGDIEVCSIDIFLSFSEN